VQLIEKEGAARSLLKGALAGVERPGKGASDMAEQLVVQEGRRSAHRPKG
jgi:hypothetical protein